MAAREIPLASRTYWLCPECDEIHLLATLDRELHAAIAEKSVAWRTAESYRKMALSNPFEEVPLSDRLAHRFLTAIRSLRARLNLRGRR